jgi:hypothetical protein
MSRAAAAGPAAGPPRPPGLRAPFSRAFRNSGELRKDRREGTPIRPGSRGCAGVTRRGQRATMNP